MPPSATLVDAHSHLHACFELEAFLDGAWRAFGRAAAELGRTLDCGVLLLAQTAGDERFERLAAGDAPPGATPGGKSGWSIARTGEPESLVARRADGARILLVCGRQLRTAEGLELLALATCARFADGQPIAAALRGIEAAGAVPVLPWGVGKWTGVRGRVVAGLIDAGRPGLACGDNANRPRLWPEPALLRRARGRGLRVLPGSDPLPLPSEAGRAGRFGLALEGPLDADLPAQDLARRLADPRTPIVPYGRLESPWRFARNQALLRLRGRAAPVSR